MKLTTMTIIKPKSKTSETCLKSIMRKMLLTKTRSPKKIEIKEIKTNLYIFKFNQII